MDTQQYRWTRRRFLQWLAATGAGAILTACGMRPTPEPTPPTTPPPPDPTATSRPPTATETPSSATADATAEPTTAAPPAPTPTPRGAAYLAVARGADPAALTMAALAALGGMERFVNSGADVIIKPNICTDYYPTEYGATTNPEVVAALVRMALGAGARRVRVMDMPFGGSAESAYERSGIAAAVAAAGGEMELMSPHKFRETAIPDGRDIKKWELYQELFRADLVINVPIAKHHNLTQLTLGAKNLIGVAQNPGRLHTRIHQRIADLLSAIRPQLTVVDAVRTLMRGGPTGGNLDDVRLTNTVIASHDPVAADAYGATLFDFAPEDIGFIKAAAEMGLGSLDLGALTIEELAV